MSLTQPAPDDSIDLELGEVYYGGQKALEDHSHFLRHIDHRPECAFFCLQR